MTTKNKIVKIIYVSIDEINSTQGTDKMIRKALDSILYGNDGGLDSLGLVNLIVSIEENINNEFDVAISLADEKALSQNNSPFRSVDTLAEYILGLLNEQK